MVKSQLLKIFMIMGYNYSCVVLFISIREASYFGLLERLLVKPLYVIFGGFTRMGKLDSLRWNLKRNPLLVSTCIYKSRFLQYYYNKYCNFRSLLYLQTFIFLDYVSNFTTPIFFCHLTFVQTLLNSLPIFHLK